MKKLSCIMIAIVSLLFASCISSKGTTTIAKGNDISKYKYVVFGGKDEGDAELADILMMVENDVSEKLQVVSSAKARSDFFIIICLSLSMPETLAFPCFSAVFVFYHHLSVFI